MCSFEPWPGHYAVFLGKTLNTLMVPFATQEYCTQENLKENCFYSGSMLSNTELPDKDKHRIVTKNITSFCS